MQLLYVIRRTKLHLCVCFGLPYAFLRCHAHWCCVNVACLHVHAAHQSVWTKCTWTGSFPTCVWLKPITADDSCGAAGRQWYMGVHLCSSSCRADQPQCVTLWKRMILNHWSATVWRRRLYISCHIKGDVYYFLFTVLQLNLDLILVYFGTEMMKDKKEPKWLERQKTVYLNDKLFFKKEREEVWKILCKQHWKWNSWRGSKCQMNVL